MDDIEKLAREHGTGGWQTLDDMVRFGYAVQSAERERWTTPAALVLDDALQRQFAEIERLRGVLLLMRGRLLLENPHAVTTEADALLLGPNVKLNRA